MRHRSIPQPVIQPKTCSQSVSMFFVWPGWQQTPMRIGSG